MRKNWVGTGLLGALILMAGCDSASTGTDAPVNVTDQTSSAEAGEPAAEGGYEVVAERLNTPWAIDFSGDTIYMSERGGTIVKVENGKPLRQSMRLFKPVREAGEGGLLGFVLDPDFERTKMAYIYHTYQEQGDTYNRIVQVMESGSEWREIRELLGRIPGANNHNGGRLAIGPDGLLYATTGDAQNKSSAQDLTSLAGKILRINLDGSNPDGNPFPGSPVYSYGHRNPQGLAWNSKGKLFSSEHGPSGMPGGHDELNVIEPGSNYGWPVIIGDERKEGMVTPLYHTGDKTLAPSGIAINDKDEVLVTGLRGQSLVRFSPDAKSQTVLVESEGRLRDVRVKDGTLYVITNNTDGRGEPGNTDDRLLRLKK